jgi:hypothetical protein
MSAFIRARGRRYCRGRDLLLRSSVTCGDPASGYLRSRRTVRAARNGCAQVGPGRTTVTHRGRRWGDPIGAVWTSVVTASWRQGDGGFAGTLGGPGVQHRAGRRRTVTWRTGATGTSSRTNGPAWTGSGLGPDVGRPEPGRMISRAPLIGSADACDVASGTAGSMVATMAGGPTRRHVGGVGAHRRTTGVTPSWIVRGDIDQECFS